MSERINMAPYALKEWGGGQIFDPGAYTARIEAHQNLGTPRLAGVEMERQGAILAGGPETRAWSCIATSLRTMTTLMERGRPWGCIASCEHRPRAPTGCLCSGGAP